MSKYNLQISSKTQKDFKKLNPQIKKRISKAILQLEKNRYPQQFKPLMGRRIAQYRLRIGDYRVLYDVYDDDEAVLVMRIGHRKDIYR